ncbi:hypothetical protein K1719_018867 [Acacia pycnantha]|nr:hypothetical protein K1719_018867 [Acacia pycnantha]
MENISDDGGVVALDGLRVDTDNHTGNGNLEFDGVGQPLETGKGGILKVQSTVNTKVSSFSFSFPIAFLHLPNLTHNT